MSNKTPPEQNANAGHGSNITQVGRDYTNNTNIKLIFLISSLLVLGGAVVIALGINNGGQTPKVEPSHMIQNK